MNIKPTPKQVREWAEKAGARFDPHWGVSYNTGTATFERFAELAAQWGAKQATPTSTVDFLPHDDYLRFAQRVLEGDAPTESDRKEAARMICDIRRALYIKAKQAPVEEPELPKPVAYEVHRAMCEPYLSSLKVKGALCNKPLYTATQMHDHFQAGVRAGMALERKRIAHAVLELYRSKLHPDMYCTQRVVDYDDLYAAIDAALQGDQK